jgi:hypothetical protein
MKSRRHDVHENLARSNDVRIGSERSFGLVIAVVLSVIGGARLWHGHDPTYFLAAAAALAALAVAAPAVLRPFNILWFRFGLLLHAVVTPIILALMFYTVITPIGWLMRASGKRPLALKFDPDATSYWIHRDPPGPAPESLPNQF